MSSLLLHQWLVESSSSSSTSSLDLLVRSQAHEDDRMARGLFWSYLIPCALSLTSTLFVCIISLFIKELRKHPSSMIIFLAFADFMFTLKFTAALVVGGNHTFSGLEKFEATCALTALYGQFWGMASICWSCMISVNLMVSILWPFGKHYWFRIAQWCFVLFMCVSTTVILGATQSYGPSGDGTCWIDVHHKALRIGIFFGPLCIFMAISVVTLFIVWIRLRMLTSTESLMMRVGVMRQMLAITGVFLLFWLGPLAHRIAQLFIGDNVPALAYIDASSVCIQGFANSVVWITTPGFLNAVRRFLRARGLESIGPFSLEAPKNSEQVDLTALPSIIRKNLIWCSLRGIGYSVLDSCDDLFATQSSRLLPGAAAMRAGQEMEEEDEGVPLFSPTHFSQVKVYSLRSGGVDRLGVEDHRYSSSSHRTGASSLVSSSGGGGGAYSESEEFGMYFSGPPKSWKHLDYTHLPSINRDWGGDGDGDGEDAYSLTSGVPSHTSTAGGASAASIAASNNNNNNNSSSSSNKASHVSFAIAGDAHRQDAHGVEALMSGGIGRAHKGLPCSCADFSLQRRLMRYRFWAYAPEVFSAIRRMNHLDGASYYNSLNPQQILDTMKERATDGRSGSFFFFSHDKRCIIKTVPREEARQLRKFLPHYYNHLVSNPNSLLNRYFGCYAVKMTGIQKVYIVVIANSFCSPNGIDEKYDLKGSWVNRDAGTALGDARGALGMDVDLKRNERTMRLSPEMADAFTQQISVDAQFLRSQGIIDYSLLLGIHRVNDLSVLTCASSGPSGSTTRAPMGGHSPLDYPPDASYDELDSAEALPRSLEAQELFSDGVVSIDGGEIYYFSIIDMLTTYSWTKKRERLLKTLVLRKDTKGVSVQPPTPYAKRFTSAMCTLVDAQNDVGMV